MPCAPVQAGASVRGLGCKRSRVGDHANSHELRTRGRDARKVTCVARLRKTSARVSPCSHQQSTEARVLTHDEIVLGAIVR